MSFYMLEIAIEGIRKDYYIYNNLIDTKKKLVQYLETPDGCYETVWCGSAVNLYIFNDYIPVEAFDLHPRIVYSLDKYPYIYFDAANQVIVIQKDDAQVIVTQDDADYDQYFCTNVCSGDENISVNLYLDNINPLEGRLIDKEEIFRVPMYPEINMHYGRNDLEYGDDNLSDSDI